MKSECESEFQSMEFLFLDKHIILFYLNIKLTLIGINNNVCPELEVKHTNHSWTTLPQRKPLPWICHYFYQAIIVIAPSVYFVMF